MSQQSPKLKQLENLVADAAKRVRKLKDENKKLQETIADLQDRVEKLQERGREADALEARQKKAKARVEKILGMLDTLDGTTEPGEEKPRAVKKDLAAELTAELPFTEAA